MRNARQDGGLANLALTAPHRIFTLAADFCLCHIPCAAPPVHPFPAAHRANLGRPTLHLQRQVSSPKIASTLHLSTFHTVPTRPSMDETSLSEQPSIRRLAAQTHVANLVGQASMHM
jgi:hypothetical protein